LSAASTHHFTGDHASALQELKAATLKSHDAKGDKERSKNYDEYLPALIKEFIPAIEQNKVPEGFEGYPGAAAFGLKSADFDFSRAASPAPCLCHFPPQQFDFLVSNKKEGASLAPSS